MSEQNTQTKQKASMLEQYTVSMTEYKKTEPMEGDLAQAEAQPPRHGRIGDHLPDLPDGDLRRRSGRL